MIELYDIVKIRLSQTRKMKLQRAGEPGRLLCEAEGCFMRVGGIQHLTEPEELRTFVLEYMDDPYPPYIYAARDDFEFIRHDEPPKRVIPADVVPIDPTSAGTGVGEQCNLFGSLQ